MRLCSRRTSSGNWSSGCGSCGLDYDLVMPKRPVIGVTTDSNDNDDRYMSYMNYAAAVERAGGLPVLIPHGVDHALIPQYVDLLDGICFTGGDGMNPEK